MRIGDFRRQLESLVGRGYRGGSATDLLRRPTDPRLLHITFDDGYASVVNALPLLRQLQLPCTIFVCTDYAGDGRPLQIPELSRVPQVSELATFDWDALRELAADDLVEIGSHTASHAHLPGLADAELTREIRDAKTALEDNLGRACPTFAYPYGEHDERVRRAVKAAGHVAGFAAPGVSTRIDPYQIPRTGFWRNGSARSEDLKTRFAIRVLRERGLVRRPRVKRR